MAAAFTPYMSSSPIRRRNFVRAEFGTGLRFHETALDRFNLLYGIDSEGVFGGSRETNGLDLVDCP
jgi:hypothetical protein